MAYNVPNRAIGDHKEHTIIPHMCNVGGDKADMVCY